MPYLAKETAVEPNLVTIVLPMRYEFSTADSAGSTASLSSERKDNCYHANGVFLRFSSGFVKNNVGFF